MAERDTALTQKNADYLISSCEKKLEEDIKVLTHNENEV
jgi:hypothetical protein